MTHTLPKLPYALDALAPHISQETLEYHYGKHHQTYVDNLNKFIAGTEFEHRSLEEIIRTASGGIFNNAAQIWNHTFYFEGLIPHTGQKTSDAINILIEARWGSLENFQGEFAKIALATF